MFGRRQFLWSTAVAIAAATASACGSDSDDSPTEPTPPLPQGPATLQITELAVGEGTEAANGRTAFIGYRIFRFDPNGTDLKGAEIPQSTNTFSWVVGSNGAIVGMSQGVQGMKVGGRRRLIIPPSLAYGAGGSTDGTIRPNEWIVFEIDLLAVA
jgi:FKBP-type peptidyl-prolyl cis-trans isomerase FkpA